MLLLFWVWLSGPLYWFYTTDFDCSLTRRCMRGAFEIQQIKRLQQLAQYFTYYCLKRNKRNKKSSKTEQSICSQTEENRIENSDFNLYSEKITAWQRVRVTINQSNCLLSRLYGFITEKNKADSMSQIPTSNPTISRWWPWCAALAAKPALRRSVTEVPFACVHQEILVQLLTSPQCFCLTVLGTLRSRLILHTFRHLTAVLEPRLSPPAASSFCGEGADRRSPKMMLAHRELSHPHLITRVTLRWITSVISTVRMKCCHCFPAANFSNSQLTEVSWLS